MLRDGRKAHHHLKNFQIQQVDGLERRYVESGARRCRRKSNKASVMGAMSKAEDLVISIQCSLSAALVD